MNRFEFIRNSILSIMGITNLTLLEKLASELSPVDHKMPAFFMGHGSPMNGIEQNNFSNEWKNSVKNIPMPRAIICISAHWETKGSKITAMENPKTIHDFGGFPDELFKVQYPAKGNPMIAKELNTLNSQYPIALDHEWGLDHGCWTVIRHMYPNANIPVLQLSIDYTKDMNYHYQLGKAISILRSKGILFIGSGNMVHNLGRVAWNRLNERNYGFDWAIEMNQLFKTKIKNADHQSLVNYKSLSKSALLAIPTAEHYIPLLYILGMQGAKEDVSFFNDECVGGSLTMTSVKIA